MYRTHTCGELRLEHAGQEVTLCGWVQHIRDLGAMAIVTLRDRYGLTQLYFSMESAPILYENARQIGREYVLQVKGKVTERTSKKPTKPTGDIEIVVEEMAVL